MTAAGNPASHPAFRFTNCFSEAWKLVAGVSYLDRRDINFLPIGGLVWTPDDATSSALAVSISITTWFAALKNIMPAFRAFWDAAPFRNLHFIVTFLAAELCFFTHLFACEKKHRHLGF